MDVTTIAPKAVADLQSKGQKCVIIDVRTPVEYASVHIPEARLIPLDGLDPASVAKTAGVGSGDTLYVVCKAGGRAAKACQKFMDAGIAAVVSIEGGTDGWVAAGLPVIRGKKMMSLERQTRIAAGAMVILGAALGYLVNPGFYALSAFVGAGLVFAGITDTCGMGMMLARMPWNRVAGQSPTCSTGACATK